MNMPRQSTTAPRWLGLALGLAAMMAGASAIASQQETVSPEERKAIAERADQERDERRPDRESWTSGLSRSADDDERDDQQDTGRATGDGRDDSAADAEELAEDADSARPEESWISGLPARDPDWEDTDKIDAQQAQRAERERSAEHDRDDEAKREPVAEKTLERIIESRREVAEPAGSAVTDETEMTKDDEDADGPPDSS